MEEMVYLVNCMESGSVSDAEDCGWIDNVVWTPVEG